MISYNSIPNSVIRFGQPLPCNDFCGRGVHFAREGIDTFNLQDYPLNVSPSGGASCIISQSEMIALKINIQTQGNDEGHVSLWREGERLVSHVMTPDSSEESSYDVVFFGHFDGEIDRQGQYMILAEYEQGDLLFEFEVR